MARGVNKVILIGNLGKDPESRSTQSGMSVVNITVATSDSWRDKTSGEMQERTEWHNVVFFNKLAEIAQQYLRKGSQVYVEGRLQTRKWQDKEGRDRYTTEIIAENMQMLGGRGGGAAMGGDDYGQAPARAPARSTAAPPRAAAPEMPAADPFEDDDIPF